MERKSLPKFCEINEGGKEVVCPFLIPELGGTDYCGYYGKDITEGKERLGYCEVEAVLRKHDEKKRGPDPKKEGRKEDV